MKKTSQDQAFFFSRLRQSLSRSIYQTARYVGTRLPLSNRFKLKMRARLSSLLNRSSTSGMTLHRKIHAVHGVSLLAAADAPVRAQACALRPGKISVILPVFNQADLIGESVRSVLAQTYEDFELIIVDDGSSDDVARSLAPYLLHPKVKLFRQQNQRLPKALSNGFDLATGEYWTWTSADNIMEPRMLEMLADKLRADASIGMVYANYYAIDDRGDILQDPDWRGHNRPRPETGEIVLPRSTEALNVEQDNFIGACFMYRGWIGRCLGMYDPQLGIEDYDYWMRVNAFFRIEHIGEDVCLYRYRVHDNTLSARAKEHGIFEKARRLMDYESERSGYYCQPLCYFTDERGAAWLHSRGVDAASIAPFSDLHAEPCTSERENVVVMVSISTLAGSPERFRFHRRPLVVILDDERADYLKLQGFDPAGTLVLAADGAGASRAGLVSRCPSLDLLSGQALSGVVAFAKNRHFFFSTRTAETLVRQAPGRILPPVNKHVLLQVDSFTQGGLENVVIDLALSLKDLGWQATILVLGEEGDAAAKARSRSLDVANLGTKPELQQYARFLQERHVDLVNAHFSLFGCKVCAELGVPFVQTIHNSYVWLSPERIIDFRENDADTASYVCVSATAARYADITLGLDAAKLRIITNGIDPGSASGQVLPDRIRQLRDAWTCASDSRVFLNVASIMPPKAQLQLVRAFKEVVAANAPARLVLLGRSLDDEYFDDIVREVRRLGIEAQVILAGFEPDVAAFYQAADCFVLPSYWEGWSLALGEAYANGLPCVITDVGSAYQFYGNPRVEVIEPPFGDIVDLDYSNLHDHLARRDVAFEKRLADAMVRSLSKPRSGVDTAFLQENDRSKAYRRHAEHFLDLWSRDRITSDVVASGASATRA